MSDVERKAVLVAAELPPKPREGGEYAYDPGWGAAESLGELAELALTAGVTTVGRVTQKRSSPDGRLYVGEGKLEEAVALAKEKDAELLVFDDELTPSQIRNIERLTEMGILDRTQVILDIFASRARSSEGQLQVELAQLSYLLPRLRGSASNLSRLGGGIGTRGPGETKLETDIRRVRDKIADLKKDIAEVSSHRGLLRKGREQTLMPLGALVGYTNAGKSTLLNKLTGATVLAEDMLFATLDPVTRKADLPSGRQVLLTDTVGFIRKLPHHLVAAFRATLDEAVWADFLVHVVDISNPYYEGQISAVEGILKDLGAGAKPVLLVLNKVDRMSSEDSSPVVLPGYRNRALVSLTTGEGMDELVAAIEDVAYGTIIEAEYLFDYPNVGMTQALRAHAQVLEEAYVDDGLRLRVQIDEKYETLYSRFRLR